MKPNPLPILVEFCDLKLGVLRRVLPKKQHNTHYLQNLVRKKSIDHLTHRRLCILTLTYWAQVQDPETKKQLWDCYFPRTKPHIWHLLYFEHQIPMDTLMEKSGCTEGQIRKYLVQSKVPRFHVRKIARFAMQLRDELSSKKRSEGPDARYMNLHRALTDTSRMYLPGEILD